MEKNCRPKKSGSGDGKKIKEMGFVLTVFGLVTICAFFLPVQAWIFLLGIVFIICGIRLLK